MIWRSKGTWNSYLTKWWVMKRFKTNWIFIYPRFRWPSRGGKPADSEGNVAPWYKKVPIVNEIPKARRRFLQSMKKLVKKTKAKTRKSLIKEYFKDGEKDAES